MSDDDNKFTPEELLGLKEKTKEVLASLTAREAKALRSRLGINLPKDSNPEDIGRQFKMARKRIREIEAKALRKLKNSKLIAQEKYCSFCGKLARDVKKLIESEVSNALICNECISLCVDILND